MNSTLIGKGRKPTFEDRFELPYIDLCEMLRWAPAGPLGGAHAAFSDDTLDGYFIPKGTIIFSNIWAMTRNEDVFIEPETFAPERFLTKEGTCNPGDISFAFGFGRRICPGRHFAILTVWMAMTSILSNFEIGQPEDEAGRPIKSLADVKYSDGAVSHPNDFRCVVKPRME
ncbi:cytochrome P450 [Marasmius fiardii PR-910]|nr:cytochrome P450 [Marasmius fiardii PR-910]